MLGIAVALVLGGVFAWWNSVVGWCVFSVAELVLLQSRRKRRIWLLLPLIACIGLLRTEDAMRLDTLEKRLIKTAYDNCLQGKVVWIQKTASMWKIELSDLILESEKANKERRNYGNCLVYIKEEPNLEIGNWIEVQGEMELFQEAVNPGMYDQRAYYRAQNIRYCLWADRYVVKNPQKDLLQNWIYQLRKKMANILELATDREDTGIMQAVFLGEKSNLDAELKEQYQENGIAHILAVSGLHISCIGLVIYQQLRKYSGSFWLSGILGGSVIVVYISLTGTSISALRAGIMFLTLLLANGMGKIYDMASALSLAVIVLLFYYPLQLFQCGFQLSVSTVAGIAVIAPIIYEGEEHSKCWKGLAVSFAIQCTSMPILLWHFFTYPIYSILLNALVIPFASVLLISAGAGAIIGLYSMPAAVCLIGSGHLVLKYYRFLCQLLEQIPGALQVVGRGNWQQICFYVIVLFGLFFYMERQTDKKRRNPYGILKPKRKIKFQKEIVTGTGMLLFLAAALWFLRPIPEVSITVLDVGQGDCSFVYLPDGSTMLIDGGSITENKVGAYRIKPFLYSKGVQILDYVVLTHPDADHINGIMELLESEAIQIRTLLLPDVNAVKEAYKEIVSFCDDIVWLKKGMIWKAEGVTMCCLHPTEGFESNDTNACSAVLRFEYGDFSMLFMGDLGMEQEKSLEGLEKVTVLKAGHHGSKYSTSEEFLNKIAPDHVILSYGEGNSYGHPHEEVLERLSKQLCKIWHTAKQGAIQIKLKQNGYRIYGYQ